jgi:mannose-6-phosphate isomerase-like protein (cupin superfamily)
MERLATRYVKPGPSWNHWIQCILLQSPFPIPPANPRFLQKHTVDQILTFTSGKGKATIAGKDQDVKAGDLIIVPAGTQHQFINTGPTPLILYTVYSPAEHKPTTVHQNKEQGDKEEEEGIDVPPEWARRSKAENEKLGLVEGE